MIMESTSWEGKALGSSLGDLITLLQFEYPDFDLHDSKRLANSLNKEFRLDLSERDVEQFFERKHLLEEEEAYLIRKNSII